MQLKEFLRLHEISKSEFESTGLSWEAIQKISNLHNTERNQLLTIAKTIAYHLQEIPNVHSVRFRIKDPWGLAAKIIRRTIKNGKIYATPDNYKSVVTDLIGLRALHLFKQDWKEIHNGILGKWKLKDPKPEAYYRRSDNKNWIKEYKKFKCIPVEHEKGYRSVHYIIEENIAKKNFFAEVQVRTLFEEAWSEIDHTLRYPKFTGNENFDRHMDNFSELSGLADSLGTEAKLFREIVDLKNPKTKEEKQHKLKLLETWQNLTEESALKVRNLGFRIVDPSGSFDGGE